MNYGQYLILQYSITSSNLAWKTMFCHIEHINYTDAVRVSKLQRRYAVECCELVNVYLNPAAFTIIVLYVIFLFYQTFRHLLLFNSVYTLPIISEC